MIYLYAMKIIIAAFCFAWYFVYVTPFPQYLKAKLNKKRVKPFDCASCLSVWVAALFYFVPDNILDFIFVIFVSGVLTTILGAYLYKNL